MAAAVVGRARPGEAPLIERASPADRAFLAMDSGQVPEQFGVILPLGGASGLDADRARRLISARIPAVPRLRQRLARAPFGCGGPVWIDDPGFDIRRHVRAVACRPPGDEQALLDQALTITMTRLPRSAPLWSATLVTGLDPAGLGSTGLGGADAALVVVLHHTLADGLGGLAVLASLVDGTDAVPPEGPANFPRAAPTSASLAAEAWRARLRGLSRIPQWWQLLRASFSAGGGVSPPPAARSSLNQSTGPRRAITVVRADHAALRAAAHCHGATANDAVLVAVAAALREVLRHRGEDLAALAVAVPVSGRPRDDGPALGNMVSPMLVCVPAAGDVAGRLADVAGQVRARKQGATGPAPIAALGGLFRLLAAAGGYRAYMNHQHRLHTLVSHVRGPAEPVSFGGCPVTSAIPVVVGDGGNIGVFFEVLTYAGVLSVTIITDPDLFPDAGLLSAALRAEFGRLTELAPGRQPTS